MFSSHGGHLTNASQIYPTEIQFNKAQSFDTKAPSSDLDLSITNDTVSSKSYDKGNDLSFRIANFPLLDGDISRPLPMVNIFCSLFVLLVRDFNKRNQFLTFKLLKQDIKL